MNRFEVANLGCLALLLLAVVVGTMAVGWNRWAVLFTAVGMFFAGGLVVERMAPGTRVLEWLGWDGRR